MTKTLPLVSLFALALAGCAAQTTEVATAPEPAPVTSEPARPLAKIAPWGVDLAGRDLSVKPGDDWVRYAAGTWLDTAVIPADRSSVGPSRDITETVREQVRSLIESAPETGQTGAFYKSFMDEARLDALGLDPVKPDLAAITAIPDKVSFAKYMGEAGELYGVDLFALGKDTDPDNPKLNILWISQSGIGMPDRSYYWDAKFATQREAYKALLTRTFTAIGNPDPAGAAAKVFAFETAVAKASWDRAQSRNIDLINNPMSVAQLKAYAPGVDWSALFAGNGVNPTGRVNIQQKTAIRDLAKLYAATPLATLKLWQQFHTVDGAAPYLSKAMVDSKFEYTKTITGVPTITERWKRGVNLVSGQLGEALGREYVEKYFPAASKAKITELVDNLKLAMGDRIRANSWMGDSTKQAALAKLQNMLVMVGYPDTWRDYSGLQIDPTDLYGNVKRAKAFEHAYDFSDLYQPLDRKKWHMSPQTANAYNAGTEIAIVFPAAELQAPLFDVNADDAVNYGAIGAVIGHEISHSFDDQGRKIDANGALKNWWTDEDAKRFEAQAKVFGDQYAKFEPVPGSFVNPELTMGENIADLAGLHIALDAYHKSLNGKEAPVLDGLTGDQRFFLAYAQAWRTKMRENDIRNRIATDPHSPDLVRSVAPLRDIDAWYAAFGIQPGDKMYIPPEQRARIW